MKRFLSFALSLILFSSFFIISNGNKIYAATLGDVNNDGFITLKDAKLVLQFASGEKIPTNEEFKTSDCNGDGVITIDDVIKINEIAMLPGSKDGYISALIKSGFPVSYTESLWELHEKYPAWEFVPFVTGLDWETAVAGEHKPHKKQLIENSVSSIWECQCSSCKGVIQEGSVWVSASQQAVEYYLDPRNFLTEEYMFQFENTRYEQSHTQESVEAILKNTWMYNSNITYLDASGKEKTYKINGEPVKYSRAIMDAAADSGMSAYYLASKIVQEVGSSTSSYAGGSSGQKAPYNGIYNYYNIGAYTGVVDGLKWANGYMKTKVDTKMYKTASTSGGLIGKIGDGNTLNYEGKSGDFYKVSYTNGSKKYTGYVPKADVSLTTSYGRPWTDPYKSIYNGAKYIYNGYAEYQYTGYLQKFNVNSASGNLYGHEYMANIRAAASESKKTYKAYKANGILSDSLVFYIPVFKNMPNGNLEKEDAFKSTVQSYVVSATTKNSITVDWSQVYGATGYRIYRYDPTTDSYVKLTNTTNLYYKDTALKAGQEYKYKVRAYQTQKDGTNIYTKYTDVITAKTKTDSGETAFNGTGVVDIDSGTLNIRKSASSTADIIVGAEKGQAVTITAKNGEWYKVTLKIGDKEYTGYAHSDYITVKTQQPVKETCPYDEPTSNLKKGSSGEGVEWIQWYLWKLGYLESEKDVDGEFGSGTESAVKKFQTDAKIDVDGIVGSGTRTSLKAAYK